MPYAVHKHETGILKRIAATALVCGDVEVVGTRIGCVAGLKPIEIGDAYTLDTSGVKTMTAKTSDVWADGDVLYWDATNLHLTDVAGSHVKAGLADGAKLSGEAVAGCDINQRA